MRFKMQTLLSLSLARSLVHSITKGLKHETENEEINLILETGETSKASLLKSSQRKKVEMSLMG